MKRAAALLVVMGLLVAPASAGFPLVERAAKAAARDHLGVLLTSRSGSAPVRVVRCRKVRGGWARCWVRVRGTSLCAATLRVKARGDDYSAWAERLRCR